MAMVGIAKRIPITPNIFPPATIPIKIQRPETPSESPKSFGLIT